MMRLALLRREMHASISARGTPSTRRWTAANTVPLPRSTDSEKRRQIRLKTEMGGEGAAASTAVFTSDDIEPVAVTMMWPRRLSYGCAGERDGMAGELFHVKQL
jgi:hypothetical protein